MVQWATGSGMPNGNSVASSGQSNAADSPAHPPANSNTTADHPQQQSQQQLVNQQQEAKPVQYNKLQPKINLGMSKADMALMNKKLETMDKNDYGSYSPRAQRKKSKYAEIDGSESESEDEDKKKKSKFFKHTEKERDDDRRKRREERQHQRENDDDYQPEEGGSRKRHHSSDNETESNWLKRRKKEEEESTEQKPQDLDNYVPKKVFRKIERKFVTRTQKIDPDTIMESSNYQKFNRTLENIFDAVEEVNIKELEENEDGNIPPEILIGRYQAHDLAAEAAKLKSLDAMDNVPVSKLVKLLNIMQWTIKDGSVVTPLAAQDDDEDEDNSLFLDVAIERVNRAADVSLCALQIMTSKNMNKRVFIDDVIDKIVLYTRFQLQNTIYPSYDPVYKEMSKHKEGYTGSMKKKRHHGSVVRDKTITKLYSKCNEIMNLIADLMKVQLMTDTTVLHLSTLGVAPFFVENVSELQLNALKLVTGEIFYKLT